MSRNVLWWYKDQTLARQIFSRKAFLGVISVFTESALDHKTESNSDVLPTHRLALWKVKANWGEAGVSWQRMAQTANHWFYMKQAHFWIPHAQQWLSECHWRETDNCCRCHAHKTHAQSRVGRLGNLTILMTWSLIKSPLQDALKWEGDKLEALPCVELVLELHPERRRAKQEEHL